MTDYNAFRSELAGELRQVMAAVETLRSTLESAEPLDLAYAEEQLVQAVERYTGTVAAPSRRALDAVAKEPTLAERERASAEILASALADVEVAAALIVAGGAVGETPEAATPEDLEAVAENLKQLTQAITAPEVTLPGEARRFGFDEVATPKAAASPDIATAKAAFEKQIEAVYKTLQAETKKVLKAGFTGVEELDDKALGEAIGMVGKTAQTLPGLGKLVSKGLQLTLQALETLTDLLGKDLAPELQKQAQELLKKLKDGDDIVDHFLAYSFGVAPSTKMIRDLLAQTSADKIKIDGGVVQLTTLQTHFTEQATMIGRLIKALNTSKKFVGKLLPEATGVLLFGVFYLVAMDYMLLAGMDYADTTTWITFVPGVVKTAEAVLR